MNLSTTIAELYYIVCKKWKDKIAYRYKEEEEWKEMTYTEFLEKSEQLAIGFLELGIKKGDRVGVISENRIEWVISVAALTLIGAIDVPLFPTTTSKQEEAIFKDCRASAVIVSNNFQLNKVLEFKDNVESLRHIFVMNDDFYSDDLFVRKLSDILERGSKLKSTTERKNLLQNLRIKFQPDDIVTLVYTSGTTGEPKGVMLTNQNLIANAISSTAAINVTENDTTVSFLPLCHCFERMTTAYVIFAKGAPIAITASIDTLMSVIQDIKPSFMTSVPKFLDTVKKRIYSSMQKSSAAKYKLFEWAVKIGMKYVENKYNNKSNALLLPRYNLAKRLVLSKIKEKIAPNLKQFIVGGAALSSDTTLFFEMLGIQCLQGYGLTEAAPVVSVARYNENEVGTVGKPLPEVEIKIAEDGELLIRGKNIMKGYWEKPEATKEVIDSEGWLYSGDIVKMTEKNNIQITDRKKYIIVNSGGKNIAPQPIETVINQSKYIEQCVLIGDNREYCIALLTPNYEEIKELAAISNIQYNNEEELLYNQQIIAHIKRDIDHLQKDFSKFERVRKFQFLIKPFSLESGELTPKLSIRRHVVEKNYSELIESIYGK